ncbi:DUF1996 domain-containing protein [Streptomyces sp. NPDC054961]
MASATGGPGAVELRTGSPTGPLLASFEIAATGGWQSWATRTADVSTHPAGAQSVFAVMRSSGAGDFVNVNWFSFAAGSSPGWVGIDRAKWDTQLARFRAMTPAPVPANSVRVPEFNATCVYSHSKPDDPIVAPGLPGASHMHSFFGNRSTDAFSTAESLLSHTATSCTPAQDLSSYWIPTLYEHGRAVEPEGMIVYYGSRLPDPTATVPFPQGFRMIAGTAKSQCPRRPARSTSSTARARAGRPAAAPTATGRCARRTPSPRRPLAVLGHGLVHPR